MVAKQQVSFLLVTRKNIHLELCIVPSVPSSPQNRRVIWINIMLTSTTHQHLTLPSSVHFATNSFQVFTIFGNYKNTQHGFPTKDSECWTWRYHQGSRWFESQGRVALMSTFSCISWTWTSETQNHQLCYRNFHGNKSGLEARSLLQQPWVCIQSESGFLFILNLEDRYFHAHRKIACLTDQKKIAQRMIRHN